jgi:sugar phosphate isomerase/epimerase
MVKVKSAGYHGIEYAIAADTADSTLDQVWNLAVRHNLQLIPQHYDTNSADFNKHYDEYATWLDRIHNYPALKINSQTGKDFFSFEQNNALIALAGAEVIHETHRGKFSFAAHITAPYLLANPELKITFDVSHWVAVAESFLDDQADAVALAISRAQHIHARVGFPEGPQIPDPRVPLWQEAVRTHINWWSRIAEAHKDSPSLTVTPEFGPFPYLVHDVSQWDINVFMMELLQRELNVLTIPSFSRL